MGRTNISSENARGAGEVATAAAPSSALGTGLPTGLLARLRAGSWRRWFAVVLAFNIALGMGFSVVALRHQADSRSHADVLLSDLDAAAASQEAALWRAVSADTSEAGESLDDAAEWVDAAARRVASATDATVDDGAISAALVTYRNAADRVVTTLQTAGPAMARAVAQGSLVPAARTLHTAVADTAGRHREANVDAGLVADVETLFTMVFAAIMAGLLFRRFEAARRSGEL